MSDLDKSYFNRHLAHIVMHLENYTPEEMARALTRMACVADSKTAMAECTQQIENPLEAVGIVMRETGTHIDSTTEIRFYDKRGQQCLRVDTCDIYGTTSGEGILNTLKEGK